ncbi:MAG: glycosyltransferase family 4 protein [Bryobacteraceae bacterium]
MKPQPILLLVRELGIGGAERDLTKVAKHLDRSRFEPHVGCFRDQGLRRAELEAAGVPVVRFPVHSFRSPSVFKALAAFRRYAKQHKIAFVHAFDLPTNIFGCAGARFSGLPFIASQLWFRESIYYSGWRLHLLSMRVADAVVVNSHAVEERLLREQPRLRGRVHVSHNGVETEFFHPCEGSPTDGPLVIGSVCALRQEKRMDLLLDAFAQIHASRPGIRLLIVGSGDMLASLEQQRDRLRLGGDCVFEPAKEDVSSWMRRIDIFALCSDSESFPNALLEAMASGCCVVGSRIGGVPELIADGRSGLLFEPGNTGDLAAKLAAVVDDQCLRGRLAREAARTAREDFSIEAAVGRLEKLYNRVLE